MNKLQQQITTITSEEQITDFDLAEITDFDLALKNILHDFHRMVAQDIDTYEEKNNKGNMMLQLFSTKDIPDTANYYFIVTKIITDNSIYIGKQINNETIKSIVLNTNLKHYNPSPFSIQYQLEHSFHEIVDFKRTIKSIELQSNFYYYQAFLIEYLNNLYFQYLGKINIRRLKKPLLNDIKQKAIHRGWICPCNNKRYTIDGYSKHSNSQHHKKYSNYF